jgi:DNA-3-methyladenine glycosylase II
MEHIAHLQKDKKMATILSLPANSLKKRKNIPLYLMASIMSQQLNTKVADIIHKRFLNLYKNKEPSLEEILNTPPETLRSIGLSNAKVSYVHNVARFCLEQNITDKKLHKLNNDEVIALLTEIKGVGKWTVEMLLMFALCREDIFAIDDLGLQNAMIKLYNLKITDKKLLKEKILKLSAKWSPYRTYACMYLWQWKDNKPVIKSK